MQAQQPAQKAQKEIPAKKRYLLQDQNRTVEVTIDKDSIEINGTKKTVLVIFFTSWCPSCKAELQELRTIYPKYKEKLDIIGLQLDDKPVEAPFFISRNINANEAIAKAVYAKLHAPASMPIPLSLLLHNNEYVIHYVGAVPLEMIEIDIKKVLGE